MVLTVTVATIGALAWLGPLPEEAMTAEAAAPLPLEPPAISATVPALPFTGPTSSDKAGTTENSSESSSAAPIQAEMVPPETREQPPEQPAESPSFVAEAPLSPLDPVLSERGIHGFLPKMGPNGREARRSYARPFDHQDRRPRLAIVLGGLGLNAALTEEVMARLPPTMGLAFTPYAARLQILADTARQRGMEVLVSLPLEPARYPVDNPGERALLTGLPGSANDDRLDWALTRFGGYVGAIGAIGVMRGERFAAVPDLLATIEETLRRRGLLYLDPRPGAPHPERAWGRSIDLVLDDNGSKDGIEQKLEIFEQLARDRGAALAYAGEASPALIDRLQAWAATVESRGFVLAPVTALQRRPGSAAQTTAPSPRQ